jgi:hypothetical protein
MKMQKWTGSMPIFATAVSSGARIRMLGVHYEHAGERKIQRQSGSARLVGGGAISAAKSCGITSTASACAKRIATPMISRITPVHARRSREHGGKS